MVSFGSISINWSTEGEAIKELLAGEIFGPILEAWLRANSGISATFCPTMILSLFWLRLTARGALAAMLSGFASVPFFKFVAPQLPVVGDSFAALSELPPAFIVSGLVAIGVSLLDREGAQIAEQVQEELLKFGPAPTTHTAK